MNISPLATPEFISTVFSVFTCFEIPINLFGTYCILSKTPNSMKSVKWAILNLHFWSSLMDFSWSVLARPLLLVPAFAGSANGFFNYLEIPSAVQLYLSVCLFGIVSVSVVAVFENRYFMLFSKNPCWKFFRWPFLAFNVFIMVIFFVPLLSVNSSPEDALRYYQKEFPEIPFSLYQKSLFSFIFDRYFVLCSISFYGSILMSEVFIFSFLLYRHLKCLASRVKMSSKTYEMQKKFLIAVVLQITIPFFLLFGPAFYYIFAVLALYYNQVLNNFGMIFISMHGWVSTIIMLLVHEPYRNFCMSCVGFQRKILLKV